MIYPTQTIEQWGLKKTGLYIAQSIQHNNIQVPVLHRITYTQYRCIHTLEQLLRRLFHCRNFFFSNNCFSKREISIELTVSQTVPGLRAVAPSKLTSIQLPCRKFEHVAFCRSVQTSHSILKKTCAKASRPEYMQDHADMLVKLWPLILENMILAQHVSGLLGLNICERKQTDIDLPIFTRHFMDPQSFLFQLVMLCQ